MSHAATFGATYGSAPVRPKLAPADAVAAFAKMRSALPPVPANDSVVAVTAGVALRLTLAAIPCAALGYMFFAL